MVVCQAREALGMPYKGQQVAEVICSQLIRLAVGCRDVFVVGACVDEICDA